MSHFPRVKQPKYTAEAQLIMPNPKNGCKHKQPKTVEKFQDNNDQLILNTLFNNNPDNSQSCINYFSSSGKNINSVSDLATLCPPCPTGAFGVRGMQCQCPNSCNMLTTRQLPSQIIEDPACQTSFNNSDLNNQNIFCQNNLKNCPLTCSMYVQQQQQQLTPEQQNINSMCASAISSCNGDTICINHAMKYCNQ